MTFTLTYDIEMRTRSRFLSDLRNYEAKSRHLQ